VIEVQAYCCRCIPRFLCFSITDGYEAGYSLIERDCTSTDGSGNPYPGAPIQFRGNLLFQGETYTIIVRLEVRYEECWIVWEIEETGDTGERLIDHADQSAYDCQVGMRTEACVNFGGTWDLYDGREMSLSPPEGLDIATNINCGGCGCVCKCLCLSVLSQAADGTVTIVGSNDVVCAVITETTISNCSGSRTAVERTAEWTVGSWGVILPGGDWAAPATCTVTTGTEVAYAPCNLPAILSFADDAELHQINAAAGSISATSEWDIDDRLPLRLTWIGYLHNATGTALFDVWNWSSSGWEALGSQAGQAAADDALKIQRFTLNSDHVGTGANLGIVRVRISATSAASLHSDMIRLKTTRCCKIELVAPVESTTTLTKADLSDPTNCPTVFHYWQFTDTGGTNWYVSIDCAWCGGQCGSVSTACCDRPVPRTLFAEVTVACPSCVTTFTVPLFSNEAGSIWDGTAEMCDQPFGLSLSCSGTTWHIQTTAGPGACSFSGDATSVTCDPVYIVFSGFFAGGIGCCGVGSLDTSVAITITVFE
jgi:hypothetical protein